MRRHDSRLDSISSHRFIRAIPSVDREQAAKGPRRVFKLCDRSVKQAVLRYVCYSYRKLRARDAIGLDESCIRASRKTRMPSLTLTMLRFNETVKYGPANGFLLISWFEELYYSRPIDFECVVFDEDSVCVCLCVSCRLVCDIFRRPGSVRRLVLWLLRCLLFHALRLCEFYRIEVYGSFSFRISSSIVICGLFGLLFGIDLKSSVG